MIAAERSRSERLTLFWEHQCWAEGIGANRHRQLPRFVQRDEVLSAALEGLWDATARWDGARRFRTYANIRVLGAINDYLRSIQPAGMGRRKDRLFCPLTSEIIEAFVGPAGVCKLDLADEAKWLLSLLPARERLVCIRYYLQGKKMREIAAEIQRSENWVYQLQQSALRRIRRLVSRESHG